MAQYTPPRKSIRPSTRPVAYTPVRQQYSIARPTGGTMQCHESRQVQLLKFNEALEKHKEKERQKALKKLETKYKNIGLLGNTVSESYSQQPDHYKAIDFELARSRQQARLDESVESYQQTLKDQNAQAQLREREQIMKKLARYEAMGIGISGTRLGQTHGDHLQRTPSTSSSTSFQTIRPCEPHPQQRSEIKINEQQKLNESLFHKLNIRDEGEKLENTVGNASTDSNEIESKPPFKRGTHPLLDLLKKQKRDSCSL